MPSAIFLPANCQKHPTRGRTELETSADPCFLPTVIRQMSSDHKYSLPPQTRLKHYVVTRLLGRGGFGLTYLAKDQKLGRDVAIKELLPQDFVHRDRNRVTVAVRSSNHTEDFNWAKRRFLDEARILASLHHKAILPVHEIFEENKTAYLVTDFIHGDTLEEWVRRNGAPSEAQLRTWLMELLDALDLVHGRNILHRDITPGNILIDRESRPVLIDFGNARVVTGQKSANVTTVLTPGYAPFEQYTSTAEQGPPVDVYSLGAVLYRAITGKVPVDSVGRKSADNLPRLADGSRPVYTKEFLSGIDKAMAVSPENRWQTCREWKDNLRASGPTISPPQQKKRGFLAPAGIAFLTIAVVTGAFAFWKPSGQDKPEESKGESVKKETQGPPQADSDKPKPPEIKPLPEPVESSPETATIDKPFINSLGMRFVPVSIRGGGPSDGKVVLFSVFETRAADYRALFPGAAGGKDESHPVIVRYKDAIEFCDKLSQKEKLEYRLPTDHEWSIAAGLDETLQAEPMKRPSVERFTWGSTLNPQGPPMANFHQEVFNDEYDETAPVGMFKATKFGLHDMSGNVREWTSSDSPLFPEMKVVRGGSYLTRYFPEPGARFRYLYSSRTEIENPVKPSDSDVGFRCVLQP